MHNLYFQSTATPVKKTVRSNTFSGQAMDQLWVSRVQMYRLSPLPSDPRSTLWATTASSTQEATPDYTSFPTVFFSNLTDGTGKLSPQSTGPIKSPYKIYKENRS